MSRNTGLAQRSRRYVHAADMLPIMCRLSFSLQGQVQELKKNMELAKSFERNAYKAVIFAADWFRRAATAKTELRNR